MSSFFNRFKLCLTSPDFYKKLENPSSGSYAVFLYWIFVAYTFVGAIIFAIMLVISMPSPQMFAEHLNQDLDALYPQDLVVTIEKGKMRTNQKEPYSIEIPERWTKEIFEGKPVPHLVTFDAKADAGTYTEHKTVVFFTENAVVYPRKTNTMYKADGTHEESVELGIMPLADVKDTEFNRESYDAIRVMVRPWIKAIPSLVFTTILLCVTVGPFVIAGFKLLWVLLYLLGATWLVVVLSSVMNRKMPYWTLYRMSAFAAIVPITAKALMGIFGISMPFLGFTLILLVWMGVILNRMPASAPKSK